jgi:hypothetical protein
MRRMCNDEEHLQDLTLIKNRPEIGLRMFAAVALARELNLSPVTLDQV